jgi:hypothetical protein
MIGLHQEGIVCKLFENKKVCVIIVIALVAGLAVVVIFVLPLPGQATDYIEKNGVNGVIDPKWQGSGGGNWTPHEATPWIQLD